MNVEVRIGRIVLDGVELRQHERAALPRAVQMELRSLLERTPAERARPRLRGHEPDLHAPNPRVQAIARQVASAVHRGLAAGAARPTIDRTPAATASTATAASRPR
ncbi:MAG TPA: hypothetical protein VK272_13430 [Solirubrobacteraceae bacterium]|nr:hypothetical protein [Solirubrobacteraceae bacterium]